jgi:hypothetical protein
VIGMLVWSKEKRGLILNSWWHLPESRPLAHHSTNTFIPLSMRVADTVNRVATRLRRGDDG